MQKNSPRRRGRPPLSEGPSSRTLILEAALDLFSQKGYEATSLREIAGRLGLRDSAIYGHFASKAEIRDELFVTFGPHAVRAAWQSLDLSLALQDPKSFVKLQLGKLAERWMDPRERKFFRFLLMENLHPSGGSHLINIKEVQGKMRRDLQGLAELLQRLGKLRKLSSEWLVAQFISPILAIRIDVAFSTEEPDLEAVRARIDQHVELFFQSFCV